MPVIFVGDVWFNENSGTYDISLRELKDTVPHLKESDRLTISILEIRNEHNKPIRRLKPLQRKSKILSSYYDGAYRSFSPCLQFSTLEAQELNIAQNYKVAILITQHNERTIFPLEMKAIGYQAGEIKESLDRFEPFLVSVTQKDLQETVNLLLQARMFENEGRIEDTRTYLRKSLEALIKIREKIKPAPAKETEDFGRRLENLIKAIRGFVDYGGPHLGPTPKNTTDMVFAFTVELVKMLARGLEEGTIIISGEG